MFGSSTQLNEWLQVRADRIRLPHFGLALFVVRWRVVGRMLFRLVETRALALLARLLVLFLAVRGLRTLAFFAARFFCVLFLGFLAADVAIAAISSATWLRILFLLVVPLSETGLAPEGLICNCFNQGTCVQAQYSTSSG